jgi:ribosomal protein S13
LDNEEERAFAADHDHLLSKLAYFQAKISNRHSVAERNESTEMMEREVDLIKEQLQELHEINGMVRRMRANRLRRLRLV